MLARAPQDRAFLDMRALCLVRQGALQYAAVDIDRSLALDSINGRIWYIKGLHALAIGDTSGACTDLHRSVRFDLEGLTTGGGSGTRSSVTIAPSSCGLRRPH